MTDDEILVNWRQAELADAKGGHHDLLEALTAKVAAEDAVNARFGVGSYREAYRARFPVDVDAKP